MTEQTAAAPKGPNPRRFAPGVRGQLPMPKKTAAELAAIRAEIAGKTQREAVDYMRERHGLTYDQCGQVLGVSEARVARILKPQRTKAAQRPGMVWVRCTACRWRGRRTIVSHEPCPHCGADHELVVPNHAVQWVQVPVAVDALPLLGGDFEREICKVVARHVAKLAGRKGTIHKT